MEQRLIRMFCKRCRKWIIESVDVERLARSPIGVYSIAFDHGDHVLTVFLDESFCVRGDNIADVVSKKNKDENGTRRALEYFDRY